MSTRSFNCQKCNWIFVFAMCEAGKSDNTPPNYCPKCGGKWEKTPAGIVGEIKSIYHSSTQPFGSTTEEKIEKLLNELKEMAEANK